MHDALHAARLAFAEAALLALLNEKNSPFDAPDTITARFGPDGLDIEYLSKNRIVGGEGI